MPATEAERLAVARALLLRHHIPARTVAPLRDGREHHLYRVGMTGGSSALLKVPREDRAPDPRWPGRTALEALQAERDALQRLAHLPVPQPYQLLSGPPPGALMGVVPGTPPDLVHDRGGLDESLLTAICWEMGRVLAAIHTIRPGEDPGAIPFRLGCDPEDAVLLHGDYHLGNVLGVVRLGSRWKMTGVVDWTRCYWGQPESDLVDLGSSVFATNPWALEPFLAGYRRAGGAELDTRAITRLIAEDLSERLDFDPPESLTVRRQWERRIAVWGAAT